MIDKEKELILKFLSQLKETKEILRIARQHSQTNENFRSKVQRLIEQIGFIGEFVKILREKSEKKCVIFIKSELEAITQLNAHSKKLTKVTSNCEIASNLIVSLTLSIVKIFIQHKFKGPSAKIDDLDENKSPFAILNCMYETLQSFPSIEHYELLAKVLFHLTKPCYLPEASEFRVLVDTEYIGYWDLRQVTYLMDVNKDESDSTTDTIDDIILMLRSDDTFSLVIEKKHIIGLRINGRKIPTSIPLLKELKILFIDNEDLDELPKELTQLTKLRCIYVNKSNLKNIPNLAMMFPKLEYLGLRGVDLESTPDWLLEFARQHHTGKYTLEKPYSPLSWLYSKAVNKEDAAILGLLEILIGRIFIPDLIDDYIFYDSGGCCFYILNESGDVIGLTIGCENYANLWDYVSLSYFPEEICKLKHLKALRIWFITKRYRLLLKEEWDNNESDATDLWIPESIRGISSLSFLWTNANYSESLIPFLDSLDSFGKPLNEP